ncbi:putative alpha/beta hydrolase fold [Lyophyllum shimeji]|uniref:Alpha/beta hydrolase fold n=1 Tax=Lyophyllum shimeji TaxID=47721 RepID=A0A9P3UJC2_LYOSH|nr:putative alpha/beta hydrolase fold [Lyophyllum shimeji]
MSPTFEFTLDQSIHIVPSFTLECGTELINAPVAYKTWGKLNAERNNVMVICHALTGSADVQDWWGPMMGRGKAFDPSRYFIFCANVLGSPYGSASPLTVNPLTGKPYGPAFPPTTIRDDVRIHKLVLDHLGIASVAVVIGGSMGGMHTLEWPLCTPPGYVRHIVPLATSARHSAWCIAWGEAQRQCIYSDPAFHDGYYETQPKAGLAAARMSAMLTYRSRDSFEARFGRRRQPPPKAAAGHEKDATATTRLLTPPPSPPNPANKALDIGGTQTALTRITQPPPQPNSKPEPEAKPIFSAQSYLRYQGQKFIARFDANCFIHITHKMDTHDVARDRAGPSPSPSLSPSPPSASASAQSHPDSSDTTSTPATLAHILSTLPPRALVIGVASDGLFAPSEQAELAAHIPEAELVLLDSQDGHDGFLLEFRQMNECILGFLKRELPGIYEREEEEGREGEEGEGFEVVKTSVFGEAEVDGAF